MTLTSCVQRIKGPNLLKALADPEHEIWDSEAPAQFQAEVHTSKGKFIIEVYKDWAPIGAQRFYNLARFGFFDNSRFFRVRENFIAQFGIPGDPKISQAWEKAEIPDDPVKQSNRRGFIAYAMTGPDTRTTQLYINLQDNIRLDSQGFAPIGRVIQGMNIVDQLYAGYGEQAGGGMRLGKQQRMFAEGNAHLDKDFPKLDRLTKIKVKK